MSTGLSSFYVFQAEHDDSSLPFWMTPEKHGWCRNGWRWLHNGTCQLVNWKEPIIWSGKTG